MKTIVGDAAVSCYVDIASLLIMILLLLLSARLRHRKNASLRIFNLLSLCVTAICVCPFVYNAMYMQTAPWLMLFPGLAIFITVVVFNMLGDCLRDVLDPRDEK